MGVMGSGAFDPPVAVAGDESSEEDDVVGPVLPGSKEEKAALRGEYVPLLHTSPSTVSPSIR